MPLAAPAACLHHPDREAMGICVRCRLRYCSECITKLDGVNHCAGCIADLAAAEAREAPAPREVSPAARRALAALSLALVSVLAWVVLEAVLPGSG